MLTFIKTTISVALFSVVSLSASAQDLIAKQAPSDKRMKDVNNVKLHSAAAMSAADLENPASYIYTDWNNEYVSKVEGSVPANFKVDLRDFRMPTSNRKITSNYGRRWRRQHEGIDIKVYIGDTIVSAFDGKVRMVKYDRRGYGYFVVIRHTNGLETLYGHLSKQLVKENQVVRAGQPIGLGGNTGRSTGSHLHFETRLLGKAINPAYMFDFENQDVTSDYYAVGTGSMRKGSIAARTASIIENENIENATEVEEVAEVKAPAKHRVYSIKKGDTLSKISKKCGVSVEKLCKLNGISKRTILQIGRRLKYT